VDFERDAAPAGASCASGLLESFPAGRGRPGVDSSDECLDASGSAWSRPGSRLGGSSTCCAAGARSAAVDSASAPRQGLGAVKGMEGTLLREQDTASGYDDEYLLAFGELLRHTEEARLAAGRLRRSLASAVPRARRMASSVSGLPKLSVQLDDSAPGRKIEAALLKRRLLVPGRTVVAVLELPQRPEDYLVGKRRQAVRTGVNQARGAGLSVKRVEDDDERRDRAMELVRGPIRQDFGPALERWAKEPNDHSWFAVGPDGATLAVCILTIDHSVARLSAMISREGLHSSAARYMISAQAFTDAAAGGVRTILLEGALFVAPGLIEFQRRLGFRPMTVEVGPRRGGRGAMDRQARSRPPSHT
jgi:hypothetical protein